LHFWGITLHTCEVETALLALPYAANAIVVPLEDEEHQERAAAIIKLSPSYTSELPKLDTLRNDLTEKTGLMLFKQPTVVYWLQEAEDISLTENGKVSKIEARKKFFGDGWQHKERVEILDLNDLEYWRMGGQC
jgi:malonyl-CoA/methylmalonyl-CoA synthetase